MRFLQWKPARTMIRCGLTDPQEYKPAVPREKILCILCIDVNNSFSGLPSGGCSSDFYRRIRPCGRKRSTRFPVRSSSGGLSGFAEFAKERDLAGVVVYSAPKIHQWNQTGHVGYLTNWSNLDRITDVMVLVPRQGKATLLVAGVEYMLDQIEEVSWIGQVRLVSSPDPRAISRAFDSSVGGEAASRGSRSFGAEIAHLLKAEGLDGYPVAVSGIEAMPVTLYRDLEREPSGRYRGGARRGGRAPAVQDPGGSRIVAANC